MRQLRTHSLHNAVTACQYSFWNMLSDQQLGTHDNYIIA